MWDRKEIKAWGKSAFKANYWRSVLSALLITLIAGGTALANGSRSANQSYHPENDTTVQDTENALNSMTEDQKMAMGAVIAALAAIGLVLFILFTALKVFVFNPLAVGCYGFFRENANSAEVDLSILKTGFDNYKNTVLTMFLRDLFTALWFCLFIVPGIVKTYSYRMVPFILRDYPELSGRDAINASRRLMDGNKWKTFVFDLSYIGWALLGMITMGLVNVFWTEPYRQNANAALYLTLIEEDNYGSGTAYSSPMPNGPDAPYTPDASNTLDAPYTADASHTLDSTYTADGSHTLDAPQTPEAPMDQVLPPENDAPLTQEPAEVPDAMVTPYEGETDLPQKQDSQS